MLKWVTSWDQKPCEVKASVSTFESQRFVLKEHFLAWERQPEKQHNDEDDGKDNVENEPVIRNRQVTRMFFFFR